MPLKSPEAVLRSALVADATVSGLVGTKIFPLIAEATTTKPYLLWRRTGVRREQSLLGPVGVPQVTLEYEACADTYAAARTLADAVRAVLDGYGGTSDNTTVSQVSLEDESDDIASLTGGPVPDTFVVRQSYLVLWQES